MLPKSNRLRAQQEEIQYQEPPEPEIYRIRDAFVKDADPATVSYSVELVNQLVVYAATLPVDQRDNFVNFACSVLSIVGRSPSMEKE